MKKKNQYFKMKICIVYISPTRVQSSPGPRTSSAVSSGTTTPRPATATPTVPPPAPSRPAQQTARQAVQLSDLQNILSNIQGGVFKYQYNKIINNIKLNNLGRCNHDKILNHPSNLQQVHGSENNNIKKYYNYYKY